MAHLLMVWLDDCTGGTSIRPPMNLKWTIIYVLMDWSSCGEGKR